jgi:hypothetical protein
VSLNMRKQLRAVLPLLAIAATVFVGNQTAHAQDAPRGPILVELFTSEGCSSCPPADAWLRSIDASQPLPVIVLSEHVDYWDHDGWKDPYSSHLLTERQSDYERVLREDSPYTPQVIVDGASQARLGNDEQVTRVFQQSAAAPKIPLTITAIMVNPDRVRLHLNVDGQTNTHNADVYVAIALDHAESQVLHGENGGRRLVHTAVVEDLEKVGALKKGSTLSKDVEVKLKSPIDAKNLRVIAFVQESGPGKVLGSALRKP